MTNEINASSDDLEFGGVYKHAVFRKGVRITPWEVADNLVVTEGRTHLLSVGFNQGSQVTTWFGGLLGAATSPAAGWTMTDITEFTNYDEAVRESYVEDTPAAGSVTNTTTMDFTISVDSSTVYGAFLCSDNTKSGTSGTLMSAALFANARVLYDDDVLKVTYTLNTASS